MGPVVKEPTELYGIRFDNPKAIQKALYKFCEVGDCEKLNHLLKIKDVRQEIDKESSSSPNFKPLGCAIGSGKFQCALHLLRYGANLSGNDGWGNEVIELVTSFKESIPKRKFTKIQIEAIFIAMVANRILQSDLSTVGSLLNSKSASWNLFSAKNVLAEINLHFQEKEQDDKELSKALMYVTAQEDIPDINKEEFAQFCKLKSGLTLLDNEVPEKEDFNSLLQSICSQLLISSYKENFLQALGLDQNAGLAFIHKVTEKFSENFSETFKKVFLEDSEQTESMILENYSPLFFDFLQIYHHYVPQECKDQLQSILVNVTDKASKEPVAVGAVMNLTNRVNDLQRDNFRLQKTVDALQSQMAAMEANVLKLMAGSKFV